MLVLRLTPYFYFRQPEDGYWDLRYEPMGGMQVQITQHTEAVAALGVEQIILTIGNQDTPRHLDYLPGTQIVSVRLPQPTLRSKSKGMAGLLGNWALGSLVWSLSNRIRGANKKIDVIHCHCSELAWTFLAAPAVATVIGAPLVLTVHCSAIFTSHPSTLLEAIGHPAARFAERRAVSKADRVLVLTERMADLYLRHHVVPQQRLAVVPDCVDNERFDGRRSQDTANFWCRYQIPNHRRLVAFIGRIAPEKGWEVLARAAAIMSIDNVHFLICGDGHQRPEFERLIDSLGLRERFTFTGFIRHEEVPAVMARADVIAMPSLHEELGGTLLEALAAGVPIVASAVGGIPSVVKKVRHGLLVPAGDSRALANALSEVLQGRSMCRDDRAGQVPEEFTLRAVGQALVQHYKAVSRKSVSGET